MLHAVPKSSPSDTAVTRSRKRLAATRTDAMAQCLRCNERELIETTIGAHIVNGRPQGGTKTWICAGCYRRGERVVIV